MATGICDSWRNRHRGKKVRYRVGERWTGDGVGRQERWFIGFKPG